MPESTSAAHAFDTVTTDPVRVRPLLDLVVTLAVRLAGGATAERTGPAGDYLKAS
ncbi:hypothetical protein [Streptomyces roseoviridis]|uniref:Uncharacterized protein n=1 Tax=Streptomyces roseoviridis TaxID=67361 RepID=A0ABV5R0C0_9ACTN